MSEVSISERRWVAVRCCCQPTKVLGFLSLDAETIRRGTFRSPYIDGPIDVRRIVDSVSDMGRVHYTEEHAVYSEDRPIEAWLRVPGFVAATVPAPPRLGDKP